MESSERFSIIRLTALLLFFIPASALATTVTNTNNSGGGSLREAVSVTPPGGTVDFDPALAGSTIVLSSEIVITKDVTIDGPGPGALTVSGGGTTRIFNISGGNEVSISGLRLANGFVDGANSLGAAILNQTSTNLEIDDCVFESNNTQCVGGFCGTGSAVFGALGGTGIVSVSNSTFSRNSSTCAGTNCFVLSSALGNGGGGDFVYTIINSTFESNSATTFCADSCFVIGAGFGNGGGGEHEFHFFNNTFESNSASCSGDNCFVIGTAIANGGGGDILFELINNTLYANSGTCSGDNCSAQGAGFGNGGGGATADILFNTFSVNTISCSGDGCITQGASISATDVEIDSNIFFTDSPAGNCNVILTSLGYNIDNGGTCIDGSAPGDRPFTSRSCIGTPG